MQLDRLKSVFRGWVLDILAEEGVPPFSRLVPASVVKQNSDGTLDLTFIDPANLVKYVSSVTIIGDVGCSYVYKPNTQVLVGWMAGYESLPFVLAGTWWGQGGLDSRAETFDTSITFDGKLVEVKQDLKFRHEVAGGTQPTIVPGILASVLLGGGDSLFAVQCVVPPGGLGGVPTGTLMFAATYGTPWTQNLVMAMGVINPIGVPAGCTATAAAVSVQVGFIVPLLVAGTYVVVVRTGGA